MQRVRRGLVLIAVLITVTLLTLMAYGYNDVSLAEYKAAMRANRTVQLRALAESGVHYAAAYLADNYGKADVNLLDDSDTFHAQVVPSTMQVGQQARFYIISPLDVDEPPTNFGTPYRPGLSDEGAKLNLNVLSAIGTKTATQVLGKLPNMTPEVIAPILDWIDPNDKERDGGAEAQTYNGMIPSYRAKNGPLASIDELLLVKNVTADLLFGMDRNFNGIQDAGEVGEGDFSRGLAAYLTVHSRESNLGPDGFTPRVNLADTSLDNVYNGLLVAVEPELATYISLYLAKGPSTPTGTGAPQTVDVTGATVDTTATPKVKLKSVFEMVGTYVQAKAAGGGGGKGGKATAATYYQCPIKDVASAKKYLPNLLNYTSMSGDSVLWSRVNVNTAPPAVLATLPGITPELATLIGSKRVESTDDPIYQTAAWLFTETGGAITPKIMKTLEPLITTRSQVYRFQVVAQFDPVTLPNGMVERGPFVRLEAVIDANPTVNGPRPRILYLRDLTELGRGFEDLAPQ